jgi:hypothetical protein
LDLSARGPKVTAHEYDDAVRIGLENVADVLRGSRSRVLGPLGWRWGVRTAIILAAFGTGFWLTVGRWEAWGYPLLGAFILRNCSRLTAT